MIAPSFLMRKSSNDVSDNERKWFWNSISFYNYIQEIVNDEPGGKRSKNQWINSIRSFYETIEKLRPELIFVFSIAVGNNLPRTNAKNIDIHGLKAIEYVFMDGSKAHLAVLTHPSGGLLYQEAHNTIKLMTEA